MRNRRRHLLQALGEYPKNLHPKYPVWFGPGVVRLAGSKYVLPYEIDNPSPSSYVPGFFAYFARGYLHARPAWAHLILYDLRCTTLFWIGCNRQPVNQPIAQNLYLSMGDAHCRVAQPWASGYGSACLETQAGYMLLTSYSATAHDYPEWSALPEALELPNGNTQRS